MMNRWDDNWQNDFISGHQIFFYGPKISSGEQLKIGFSGHDLFFAKKKKKERKKMERLEGLNQLMHESAIAASWKKKSVINNVIYGSEMHKIVNIAFLWQD